jgi:hypothetical protein
MMLCIPFYVAEHHRCMFAVLLLQVCGATVERPVVCCARFPGCYAAEHTHLH